METSKWNIPWEILEIRVGFFLWWRRQISFNLLLDDCYVYLQIIISVTENFWGPIQLCNFVFTILASFAFFCHTFLGLLTKFENSFRTIVLIVLASLMHTRDQTHLSDLFLHLSLLWIQATKKRCCQAITTCHSLACELVSLQLTCFIPQVICCEYTDRGVVKNWLTVTSAPVIHVVFTIAYCDS